MRVQDEIAKALIKISHPKGMVALEEWLRNP